MLTNVNSLTDAKRKERFSTHQAVRAEQKRVWQEEIITLNPGVINEDSFDQLTVDDQDNYTYRGLGLYTPIDNDVLKLPRLKGRTRYLYF
jgi:hypothetical protein